MDFLGIGAGEILLILVVAFLVWGPSRIIEISRTLGKTYYNFKKVAGDLSSQVTKELAEKPTPAQDIKTDKNSSK